MADNNALLQALLGGMRGGADPTDIQAFQQTAEKNNLFSQLAPAVAGAKFDTSTWNPETQFGVSAGKAFLTSALQALGQRQVANQLESAATVLPDLYRDPLNTQAPEGVDRAAFNALRLAAATKGAATRQAAGMKAIQDMFGVGLEQQKAAAQESGKIMGRNSAYGAESQYQGPGGAPLSALDPDSPQGKTAKMIKDEADAARKEISEMEAPKQLQKLSTTLSRIGQLKDLNSSTSDIPFIYTFIQGLDGSVVKEGEYNMVVGSNPIIQAYKQVFESRLNGGSGLGVNLKNQIYSEMMGNRVSLYNEAKKQAEPRLNTAAARGVKNLNEASPFDLNANFEPTLDTAAVEREAAEMKAANPTMAPAEIAAALRAKHGHLVPTGASGG